MASSGRLGVDFGGIFGFLGVLGGFGRFWGLGGFGRFSGWGGLGWDGLSLGGNSGPKSMKGMSENRYDYVFLSLVKGIPHLCWIKFGSLMLGRTELVTLTPPSDILSTIPLNLKENI